MTLGSESEQARLHAIQKAADAVELLNRRLERSEEEVRVVKATSLPKEHFKRRFRQMVATAVIVSAVFYVLNNAAVTKCFLTPAQTGWAPDVCAVMYPGYENARKQSEANLAQFRELIGQVPVNQKRIGQLESDVTALKAGTP